MFKIVGLIAALAFVATGMAEGAERSLMCEEKTCQIEDNLAL